jgi:hypothetical protein
VSLFGWRIVARSAHTARRPGQEGARFALSVPVVLGGLLIGLLSGCAAPAPGPAGTDPAARSLGAPGSASAPTAPSDTGRAGESPDPAERRSASPGPDADPAPAPGTSPDPAAPGPADPGPADPGSPKAGPADPGSPSPAALPAVPRQSGDLAAQPAPASAPVRLGIPSLGIDMPVEGVGLDGDAMALPANPAIAAWYRHGPAPRSPAGATVIAAHVDSLVYDLGPFARLADAPGGTEIEVSTADGSVQRYAIASIDTVAKQDVPWAGVFDRSGPPRLTLVTCGGEFDYQARRYLANVIVSAVPVP